jgi:HEAT repeat protein
LKQALGSDDPLLSLGAAHAVAALAPDDEPLIDVALPELIEGLRNDRPKVRAGVAQVLGGLEGRAASATEPLRDLLNDAEPFVQAEAAGALGRIGASDPQTIAALVKLLDDPVPLVRYSAMFALGQAGAKAERTAPLLEERLDSSDPFEAAVAAWALVKIAPTEERKQAVVSHMLSALGHPSPAVRIEAAQTLREVAPGNPDVVSALRKALDAETVPAARKAMEDAMRTDRPAGK